MTKLELINMAKEEGFYLETPNGEEHYAIPMLERFAARVLASVESEPSVWLVDCFDETVILSSKKSADEYVKEFKIDGGEPVVTVLYATPQSSDAEAKLKLAIEALKAIVNGEYERNYATKCLDGKFSWEDCEQCINRHVEQALKKIGE